MQRCGEPIEDDEAQEIDRHDDVLEVDGEERLWFKIAFFLVGGIARTIGIIAVGWLFAYSTDTDFGWTAVAICIVASVIFTLADNLPSIIDASSR